MNFSHENSIVVRSITLTTDAEPIVIPISPDNPLRCYSVQELQAVARQVESLVRVLLHVAEGRMLIGATG